MPFKISTRARYSLRLMLEITKAYEEGKHIDLNRISNATGISRRYLEQLVISLKAASLLKSVAGRYGGYTLSKPPDQIPIGRIVEATIGPISITDCIESPEHCDKFDDCPSRYIWNLINIQIREILFNYTLLDLTTEECIEDLDSQIRKIQD